MLGSMAAVVLLSLLMPMVQADRRVLEIPPRIIPQTPRGYSIIYEFSPEGDHGPRCRLTIREDSTSIICERNTT